MIKKKTPNVDLNDYTLPDGTMLDEQVRKEIDEIRPIYQAALREVITKIEILDDDLQRKNYYVPIHYMESRIKSVASTIEKAERYGILDPISNIDKVKDQIKDIAGVRVVCKYIDNLYYFSEYLIKQDNVELVCIKDYCKTPKKSGYRSLHVVIKVPIYYLDRTLYVPVEIQFRTIAMDTWASLEHELKYKNKGQVSEEMHERLIDCANKLLEIDVQMEEIRKTIIKE
ncbi:MAG: GTP pyrophosphokinase family protein [Clostridiales bacterium]|nr:GTP pyrophosphokinase family protein [Clostridiales bacterium]